MSGSGGGNGNRGVTSSDVLKAAATAFTAAAVGGVAVYTLLQAIDTKKVSGFVSDMLGTSSKSKDEAKTDVEGNSLNAMAEKDRRLHRRRSSDDGCWDDESPKRRSDNGNFTDEKREQRRKAEAEAEIERMSFNALIAFDPEAERKEIESEFRRIQTLTDLSSDSTPRSSSSSATESHTPASASSKDLFLPGFRPLPSTLAQHIFHFLSFDRLVLLSPVCRRWWLFLRLVKRNRAFLRVMALRGFPNHCRAKFWQFAASADVVVKRMLKQYPIGNPTLYQRLLQQEAKGKTKRHLDAIAKDVGRTFTHHEAFYSWNEKENRTDEKLNDPNENPEHKQLRAEIENEADETLSRILTAYAIHDPQLGYCFTPDHQILTLHGFVAVDEIKSGDLVASYSADDKNFKFVPCFAIKKLGKHSTYTFKSQVHTSDNIEVTVTDEHNMWVQKQIGEEKREGPWQKVKARDLYAHFRDSQPQSNGVKESTARILTGAVNGVAKSDADMMQMEFVKVLTLNENQIDAFLQVYGYWLSNDSWDCSITSSYVIFTPVNTHHKDWLQEKFATLNLKRGEDYIEEDETVHPGYRVTNKRWLKYFCGEYGKQCQTSEHESLEGERSAKWYWSWYRYLDMHHCRQIMKGLTLRTSDASENGCESFINTSCLLFRDETIDLAIRAGYVADFSMERGACPLRGVEPSGNPGVSTAITWRIRLSEQHELLLMAGNEEESSYTGPVHCVSVGGDGLIIARKVFKSELVNVSTEHEYGYVSAASRPMIISNCQGMNFVAAYILSIVMPRRERVLLHVNDLSESDLAELALRRQSEEEAFWLFHCILNNPLYQMRGFFTKDLANLMVCRYQFSILFDKLLPKLSAHFKEQRVPLDVVVEWYMTFFTYRRFPRQTLARIWDLFLVIGHSFLHSVVFALLALSESRLLTLPFEEIIGYVKALPDDRILQPEVLIGKAVEMRISPDYLDDLAIQFLQMETIRKAAGGRRNETPRMGPSHQPRAANTPEIELQSVDRTSASSSSTSPRPPPSPPSPHS